MEPSKFEKHIVEKLSSREINPSDAAWDRISKTLDNKQEVRKNKRVYWYAIAASFIGLLFVSFFVLNKNNEVFPEEDKIVASPSEEVKKVEEEIKIMDKEVITFEKEDRKIEVTNTESNTETFINDWVETKENPQISDSIEKVLDFKIYEVVAQVNELEKSKAISDAEVDSLLRKAQDEILLDKIFQKDKSVDAVSLLAEVENELDQSFRDQIFEKLKTGYFKIKTAVADRNN